jgi:hypothetical protein
MQKILQKICQEFDLGILKSFEQIEAEVNSTYKKAINDVWVRLSELVCKVSETLGQPNKKFHDTLITNLQKFCTLMPCLNIMDDSNIEEMQKEVMEQLAKLKPDDLRKNKVERKKAANTANSILKKLNTYMKN